MKKPARNLKAPQYLQSHKLARVSGGGLLDTVGGLVGGLPIVGGLLGGLPIQLPGGGK